MPVITIEAVKLDTTQKRQLITEMTRTASEIMSIPEQAFTILIKENELENIGFAGKMLADR